MRREGHGTRDELAAVAQRRLKELVVDAVGRQQRASAGGEDGVGVGLGHAQDTVGERAHARRNVRKAVKAERGRFPRRDRGPALTAAAADAEPARRS